MKTPEQLRSFVNKSRSTEKERKENLLSVLGSSCLEIRYIVAKIYVTKYGEANKVRELMPLSSSCQNKFRTYI